MCQYQVNIARSILFLVVTFACSTTFAAMYKWVDEEGNTHYTQQPPPDGIESKTLKPPPAIDGSETTNIEAVAVEAAETSATSEAEQAETEKVSEEANADVVNESSVEAGAEAEAPVAKETVAVAPAAE